MYLCKDVYWDFANKEHKKHDIAFSDELLDFLGVTEEYMEYMYNFYLELRKKNDGNYCKLGVGFRNLKIIAEEEFSLRGKKERFDTYWWMIPPTLWDIPEARKYKIYPEIRWFHCKDCRPCFLSGCILPKD